jgi:hypothetical protein
VTKPEKNSTLEGEAEDQPPKVEFTPVVEEGVIYSKRYISLLVCSHDFDSITF